MDPGFMETPSKARHSESLFWRGLGAVILSAAKDPRS